MPAKPQWLLRVPEILERLSGLETPVIDRSGIEQLFGLKRRQAISVLQLFGGYQAGKTFLVDRQDLIRQLEKIATGQDFHYELKRRQNVAEEIDKARKYVAAAGVKISVREGASFGIEGLPAGVDLKSGELSIEFKTVEDLLSKLYELGQTIANDFERFKAVVEDRLKS